MDKPMTPAMRYLETARKEHAFWQKMSSLATDVLVDPEIVTNSEQHALRALKECYRQLALGLLHAKFDEMLEIKNALMEIDRDVYGD